jgi:hypothetical protein
MKTSVNFFHWFGFLVVIPGIAFAEGDFLKSIDAIEREVSRLHLDRDRCAGEGAAVVSRVRSLDPHRFDLEEIKSSASDAVELLFDARLMIHDDLSDLHREGSLVPECVRVARRVIRHLRGVEDYIGSLASMHGSSPLPSNPLAPDFLPDVTLVNSDVRERVRLQSGDILLSRGNANVSALIARMADEDTQFSHIAMVYVDPGTKDAFTIEAHIEVGAKIFPIGEWLKDGKVRTVLFRQKDPIRAAVAARYLFERVKTAQDAGRPVRYDFPFEMDDHRELFCSEVVRQGYEFASAGTFMVPAFPSKFTMKNRDLLERLGISVEESFLPEDIEMDPRFQLIAEWRDFSRIGDAVRKDAIMDAIYHLMEEDGYRFHPAGNHRVKARLAKVLRNLGFMKERMPTYMRVKAIEVNLMIEDLMQELEDLVRAPALMHQQETGRPFSFFQFSAELARLRNEGAFRDAAFQRWFYP